MAHEQEDEEEESEEEGKASEGGFFFNSACNSSRISSRSCGITKKIKPMMRANAVKATANKISIMLRNRKKIESSEWESNGHKTNQSDCQD